MGTLTVVRAGAGSGKTHDLCEHIAERVAAGLDPARVLATTFTRKAAAELKGRIQARLLADRRPTPRARQEKAERLELAAIGTVHSVGRQLLGRYALALGLSPSLTVLEEGGSARTLRDLLAQMDPRPWEGLATVARRFSLEDPQGLVLDLLDAKRGNDIADQAFCAQMTASAERLVGLMAPSGPRKGRVDFEQLYARMQEALNGLEGIQDGIKKTAAAVQALRQHLARRERVWRVFIEAGRLEAGKQKSGADALLQPLREVCAGILGLPAFHADVRELLAGLAERTLALEAAYATFKRERGLLDFTDLEVWLLRLLVRPDLSASLREEFALVVVDEFHDTNPLQLAIFQRLRGLAGGSRWVGDTKQAIYSFRGADPNLVKAVWDAVPESSRERLPKNYRSQKGLVRLVGRLFTPVFGDEVCLAADRKGAPRGIRRWLLEAKTNAGEYAALAAGIARLRDEGVPLGSVAVLARTNSHAKDMGAALRALGLPALLEIPGLLATREGALVLAGLRLAADRRDSLAAATIAHILGDPGEATPAWVVARLQALREQDARRAAGVVDAPVALPVPWGDEPRFARLAAVDHRLLHPSVVVTEVIEALDAGNALRTWGDPAQRAANLDTLVALAAEYEAEAQTMGSVPTLSGLIAHLEGLAADEQDAIRPPYGIDAVTLLTYHGAKGLEWPVVILTDLDAEYVPDMWKPVVTGGDLAAENPLAGRSIRYWPWPFGGLRKTGLLGSLGLDELAQDSPEGQEAAARGMAESTRLLYVGFTRARDALILAHRPGKDAWLQALPEAATVLPPDVTPGEHPLAGIGTTYVLERLDPTMAEALARPRPAEEPWLAPLCSAEPSPIHGPRYWSPSEAEVAIPPEAVTVELLPGEPIFPKMEEAQEVDLGNAVHAYLTALPSLAGLDTEGRRDVAARCLVGWGVEKLLSVADLVAMGDRLEEWVSKTYPGAAWHTEVPVTAPRNGGGQWSGSIDLLLRLPNGNMVVVDHKSGPVRREHIAAKAASYAGQLEAYREALAAQGLGVAATWIHFPLAAGIARLEAR
jgi:ATP-dependent helicase/nuclease subunit A